MVFNANQASSNSALLVRLTWREDKNLLEIKISLPVLNLLSFRICIYMIKLYLTKFP